MTMKLFLWMEQRPVLARPLGQEGGRRRSAAGADPRNRCRRDPIYAWLEKLNAEKESFEAERLLAVASTRAKQRLHLLGGAWLVSDRDGVIGLRPPAEKRCSANYGRWSGPFMPRLRTGRWNRLLLDGRAHPRSVRRCAVFRWLGRCRPPSHAQWKPPPDGARTQDDIEFSRVSETARHVGSIVHRWLQRIADDELKGWDAARVEAQRTAYRQELSGAASPMAISMPPSGAWRRHLFMQ